MINIPTTQEIYTDIISDLEAEFSITIPTVGSSFLRAMAAVQAGKMKLYYLAQGKLQKNIFIDTADPEAIGGTLERFGRVKLGRNPFPATAGSYTVQVTGTIGTIIPQSSTFKSNDDSLHPGILYILDADYTLLATTDSITLRCLTAGLEGQLSIGDELTITAPVALLDDIGEVTAELVEPIAAEDIEDYRRKGLDAYRLEPQGGAGSDYRLWASDAQGVETSYPYAKTGVANEINLFIEATIVDSIDGKGTPTAAILTAVEDAIEDPTVDRPSRKPLGVYDVHYLPIAVREVDIEITGFVGITAPIQTAIFNAIELYLTTVRPFVGSIDTLADQNDTFDVNTIIALILEANPGSQFGAVVMEIDSVPLTTFTFLNGDIPFLDAITYV